MRSKAVNVSPLLPLYDRVQAAMTAVRKRTSQAPRVGIILGSGLGNLAKLVRAGDDRELVSMAYTEIPYLPESTVVGHAGRLILGVLEEVRVAVFQGRFHYYEGYSLEQVTFSVRLLKSLGAQFLIVTNAAGGIAERYNVGDLVALSDHINLMGENPLRGVNDERLGPRFPNMVNCYDPQLRTGVHEVARASGVVLKDGVYVGLSGPCFETHAEVAFLRSIGADMVGMSTVPEVIVARQCALRTLGISMISNVLYGAYREPCHEEVLDAAKMTEERFVKLITGTVRRMGELS